jgi:hypothetical protein
MPIVPFIPAIIGAGVGLYGASQAKKSAKEELAAQTQANDKSEAAQERNFNTVVGLNEDFRAGGLGAFNDLLAEYHIAPYTGSSAQPAAPGVKGGFSTSPIEPGGGSNPYAGTGVPAGGQSGAPSYNAYLQANPDLAAEAQRVTADGEFPSVGAYLQYHDQQFPQEGRPSAADPAQPQAPAQPAQQPQQPATPAAPQAATDLMTAQRPNAAPAPTFARPDSAPAPTYQRSADRTAPQLSSYTANFQESPDYQFRLNQGLDAANNKFAARGLLKSSGAAKGIADYASNLASQEYGNFYNRALSSYGADNAAYQYGQNRDDTNFGQDRTYGTNLFLNQQGRQDQNFENDRSNAVSDYRFGTNRADTNFETDRGYQTNRDDTRIGNIFKLAGYGSQATSNITGASNNLANQSSNIYGNQADATSAAAQQRAAANAYGAGAIGSAAGNIYAAYKPQTTSADPYSNYSFARI